MKTGAVLIIALLLASIASSLPVVPAAIGGHQKVLLTNPPKPEGMGPIPVGTYNDTITASTKTYPVNVMVFYPAQSNGSSTPADKSKAPYPTVIVLPFFGGDQLAMGGLATTMASWGIVSMTVGVNWTDFPSCSNSSDMNDYLDYLEAQNSTPTSPIYQMVDKEAFGLSGYSSGGGIAVIDTALVDRIKASETMAAAIDSGTVDQIAPYFHKPILLQVGQDDNQYRGGSEEAYRVFKVPRSLREIYGASHGGPFVPYLFPAFYLYQFGRVPSYETYIYGEEAVKDNIAGLYSLSFYRNATDFFPPLATATASRGTINMDEPMAFNATMRGYWPKSYPQNKFQWDIDGDGYYESTDNASMNTTVAYTAPGLFTPRFTYSAGNLAIASNTTDLVNVKNVPPVAIAGEDITVNEDQVAHFGGSMSYDTPSDSLVFKWAFGDGASTNFDANPLVDHAYTKSGRYVATLTVKDLYGAISTDKINATVKNVAPIAEAGKTVNGLEDQVLTVTGTGNDTPSDIPTLMFRWDLGDGNSTDWAQVPVASHAYAKQGNYTATFFVKDNDGAISSDTVLVKITDVAPSVMIGSPDNNTVFDQDSQVEFQGAGQDTVSDQSTLQYMWDLGDGSKTIWEPLAEATHTYRSPGRFQVTLWVKDDDGRLSSSIVNITINNLAPIASILSPATGLSVREDQEVLFNGSGEDTPSDLSGLTYWWTIDGNVFNTQNIHYNFTNKGTYEIDLIVTDAHGASSKVSVEVAVSDPAPALMAQVTPLTFKAGGAINFSAQGNDTISDRDNLTYVWTFGDGFFSNYSNGVHTFGVAGTYNVKVVVTDDEGATATKSFSVVVSAVEKPKPVNHTDKGPGILVLGTVAGLTIVMVVCVVIFLLFGRGKGPKAGPEEDVVKKTPKKKTSSKKLEKEKRDED